jgi:hypothetical protein
MPRRDDERRAGREAPMVITPRDLLRVGRQVLAARDAR